LEAGRPDFDWDEANHDHIAQHKITPAEAEQAILDEAGALLEIQSGTGEERVKSLGMTGSGRILVVLFALRGTSIRPITAYPAPRNLQRLYFERRPK
jgi:uncharacterized protein